MTPGQRKAGKPWTRQKNNREMAHAAGVQAAAKLAAGMTLTEDEEKGHKRCQTTLLPPAAIPLTDYGGSAAGMPLTNSGGGEARSSTHRAAPCRGNKAEICVAIRHEWCVSFHPSSRHYAFAAGHEWCPSAPRPVPTCSRLFFNPSNGSLPCHSRHPSEEY